MVYQRVGYGIRSGKAAHLYFASNCVIMTRFWRIYSVKFKPMEVASVFFLGDWHVRSVSI